MARIGTITMTRVMTTGSTEAFVIPLWLAARVVSATGIRTATSNRPTAISTILLRTECSMPRKCGCYLFNSSEKVKESFTPGRGKRNPGAESAITSTSE